MSLHGLLRIVATAVTLSVTAGCVALYAVKAVPMVVGTTAVATAQPVDRWQDDAVVFTPMHDHELGVLDDRIRLAECGDAESQYWIATRLEQNLNMNRNEVEIYKWYRLSQLGQYAPAKMKLDALNVSMPLSEITKAQVLVDQWTATTHGCPFKS